ncbi:MAG: hypothetical protein KBA81_05945 [Rhabdochlamydiaceae bacterium]|nr:hypothetical protein [Rhabdochlamydiaceae bacterium]
MIMTARKWMLVSGLSWLAIGAYLMIKGLKWVTLAMMQPETPALMGYLKKITGSLQQGALVLICISLLMGFIKGRMVLSKTVSRIVSRLKSLESISFSNAYDRKYYIILASMMGLGLLFRFLPIAYDIRGFIDVTIGSALMNGAMLYFRAMIKESAVS